MNQMKSKKTNKLESLSTSDLLNEITRIQTAKIEKLTTEYQNKPITKESEWAMQNMIEIIKLRYQLINERRK